MTSQGINNDDIWTDAVAQYENETGHAADDGLKSARLTNPEDLLRLIESKGQDFQNFRQKHEKVCSRLKECLGPVSLLNELASKIAGKTPFDLPAAILLSSVSHLITVSASGLHSRDAHHEF